MCVCGWGATKGPETRRQHSPLRDSLGVHTRDKNRQILRLIHKSEDVDCGLSVVYRQPQQRRSRRSMAGQLLDCVKLSNSFGRYPSLLWMSLRAARARARVDAHFGCHSGCSVWLSRWRVVLCLASEWSSLCRTATASDVKCVDRVGRVCAPCRQMARRTVRGGR